MLLGMGSAAMAQTQAGNFFMGADIGWLNDENTYIETNNFGEEGYRIFKRNELRMQPMIGTFITNNVALGIYLDYQYGKVNDTYSFERNNIKTRNNRFSVGPFVRKFFPLNERFALYGHGNIGYGHSSIRTVQENQNQSVTSHEKYNSFIATLKPGIVFFASKKIGVDLSVRGLQYSFSKLKDSSESNNSLNAGFDLPNLNLGLNVYLNR